MQLWKCFEVSNTLLKKDDILLEKVNLGI